jgi:hypothetical protein
MEKEDQGQKGFNYRSEIVGVFDPGSPTDILGIADPATPVWKVPVGEKVRFHLVGAADKPRNYSFTIHGVAWREWRFLEDKAPMVASESAITCGTVRTFEFIPEHTGDHAYRSGMLKWSVHQGLWGILRVTENTSIALFRKQNVTGIEEDVPFVQHSSDPGKAAAVGAIIGLGLLLLWKLGQKAEPNPESDDS